MKQCKQAEVKSITVTDQKSEPASLKKSILKSISLTTLVASNHKDKSLVLEVALSLELLLEAKSRLISEVHHQILASGAMQKNTPAPFQQLAANKSILIWNLN